MLVFFFCFFFFQAEDGIRDHCVTGIQTCALPISLRRRSSTVPLARSCFALSMITCRLSISLFAVAICAAVEIGRASCRERVWISVGGVSSNKKREKKGTGGFDPTLNTTICRS